MVNEKVIGMGLIIVTAIVWFLYFVWGILGPFVANKGMKAMMHQWSSWSFIPIPPLYWLLMIPLFITFIVLGVIFSWIGLALIRSPAPPEISAEEIEEELEEAEEVAEEEEE